MNLDRWNELPRPYKAAVEIASQAATLSMMASYDARNPEALLRLVAAGTQLRSFSNEIVDALYRASGEFYTELSTTNPGFKAILESQTAFRDRNYQYHQVADFQFDAMMLRLRRRG
jgi:TRAP-type mannitol/chloroaromatic compound transport system substrate-binding protein